MEIVFSVFLAGILFALGASLYSKIENLEVEVGKLQQKLPGGKGPDEYTKNLINLSSEIDKLRIFLCSAYFLTPDEVNSAYKQMQVSGTTLETANKLRDQRNRFVAKAHEQHTNPGALDKIITGQMHFDGALALLSNRIAALEEELHNAKQIQE